MPSGTYTITVTMNGFRSFGRPGVPVTLNSTARVDAKLEVGQLTETVSVSAESPLLQTDRAEVRSELNAKQLTELPVPIGRNYQQLFKTLPGFTPPADAHSIPSNPSRALVFNVNGASRSSNNTRIDGVSTTNIWLPHVAAYVPALESLEAVNVVTNSFDAEQGLAGGSAINVQIKSGTNDLRGSGYEYYTNEQMRELNYFAPPGTSKGDWSYHQSGGTLGGPIRRNKVFFFGSYEGTRDKQQATRTVSVPTAAVRNGDLSIAANPIYDPATGTGNGVGRTAFPGNIIPQDRFDATAKKIISLMPLPNLPGETNNYFVQAPFEFNRWTLDSKVNWNATSKLNIFGRYSHLDFWTFNETVYGDTLQGSPIAGGNPGTGQGYTANFSAGGTYVFSPSLVADAHFGYVRMYTDVAHSDIGQNKGSEMFGLTGLNGPRAFEGGMPVFNFDTYHSPGITELYMPYNRNDDQYQTVAERDLVEREAQRTVRHRHLLPGPEPRPARAQRRGQLWRSRRVPVPQRPDAPQRRPGRQHVQLMGIVPPWIPGPARTPEPRGCALLHPHAELQLLRAGSVAGVEPADTQLRHEVRILPCADPFRSWPGTLQPRNQHDGNRWRRLGADGSRYQRRESALRAEGRGDIPRLADDGYSRGLRHYQRSLFARATDANEPPGPVELYRAGTPKLPVGGTDGGRSSADSESGRRQRDHSDPAAGDCIHAANRLQSRVRRVVQRRRPEGAQMGLRGRGRLRGHATDRSARKSAAQLDTDWRR